MGLAREVPAHTAAVGWLQRRLARLASTSAGWPESRAPRLAGPARRPAAAQAPLDILDSRINGVRTSVTTVEDMHQTCVARTERGQRRRPVVTDLTRARVALPRISSRPIPGTG